MKQVYTKMRVSLDAGETWQDATRVTVVQKERDNSEHVVLVHTPNKLEVETKPNRARLYEGYQIFNLAYNDPEEIQKPRTYARHEVQTWRDDIAHAAASLAERGQAPHWMVEAIRGLSSKPLRSEREPVMWTYQSPETGGTIVVQDKYEAAALRLKGIELRSLVYGDDV